ncbi:anaerobic ribonucleoside-triphosphate reductase [bacterium]|nr:anaerobic ribonucleoside-triphosphate reductase [bacterium]
MLNQNKNDNAANRKSYIGANYNIGEEAVKENVLASLPKELAELHRQGYIHIHDLDAYGQTYNCLTFDIKNAFPYEKFTGLGETKIIIGVFDFIKEIFAKMGNEQAGGMAFANFDKDFAEIFTKLGVSFENFEDIFRASTGSLIKWCNDMHTRMGQTSYYVTFNIGLGTDKFSRFLSFTLIDEFENAGDMVYKPNIVFKIHKGVNRSKGDPNFDLYEKALLCTSKKMLPTYLLCDCEEDRDTDPEKLSVMGCRTRVVNDIFGKEGAVGRGNITNISVNLPRLALEVAKKHQAETGAAKIEELKKRWLEIAGPTAMILLDRYEKTVKADDSLFPTNHEYKFWCEDMNTSGLEGTFKHGTLSIGFIGLSEAIEILTGFKYWENENAYRYALDFVAFMRDYTDSLTKKYHLNFSLLATSGELISGRFTEIDKTIFNHPALKKDFYTNSFHVNVDSGLPAHKKLEAEGPFHKFANGGSISYIELKEAPLGNIEGLADLAEIAIESGVRYLGFNFPKDTCKDCGTSGVFDVCPKCGGKDITRIRRVSGYLEILDGFTKGKKAEEKNRRAN